MEQEQPRLKDLMGEKQLAEILGVSKASLLKLRKEKGLPFIKIGIKTLYYEPDVMAWLIKQAQNK
jgi:excisionase family DNA binding protein